MYIAKKQKNRGSPHYYLIKTERINGKSRTVWQKYIGTAESLLKKLESNREVNIHSKVFGSVACMLSIAEELDFKEVIEKTITDNNYKLAVWQHILMQSICRFNEPISKKKSISWYNKSILPLLWKKKFSSPQTILNQFDKVVDATRTKIPLLEEEICRELIEKGIKPSVLIWDPTNFFTYIEKGEKLPRKGKSKEKRYDKNIINLGLVVSDENIPMLYTVYEGNKRETHIITDIVDCIYERIKKICTKINVQDLVFVFDKGNNSKDNIHYINKKFHFIGSLTKSQLKHLFDVNLSQYEFLYKNKKKHVIKGYRTKETLYGEEYTVIVTYNKKSHEKQKKKNNEVIGKVKKEFTKLEKNFKNKRNGKKSAMQGVADRVNGILHKEYRSLFSWKFDEEKQIFTWKFNEAIFKERKKRFGKTLLFTDLEKFSSKKITQTYNSKYIVEMDFKDFKDKLLIPIKPLGVRKDHRIRAHIFVCVISMIFYRYMIWKLANLKLSEKKIVEEVRAMRVAFLKQPNSGSVTCVMENMTPMQIKIYSELGLERFMPN